MYIHLFGIITTIMNDNLFVTDSDKLVTIIVFVAYCVVYLYSYAVLGNGKTFVALRNKD